MKKLSSALILILISALLFAGCGSAPAEPPETAPAVQTDPAPKAPLGRKQAVELASEHWGVSSGDVDELTGFKMNIFVDESPTAESNSFRIVLRWLVDGHYSTVDEIYIDADSGEITPVNADL